MNKKKIAIDIIYSLLAFALPIAVLQLFVLPALAKFVSDETYGLILSLISILTIIPQAFATALNNTRLLVNKQYIERGLQGDFPIYALICVLLGGSLVCVASGIFIESQNIISYVYLFSIVALNILHGYYMVIYRILINYKKILIYNCSQMLGYIVGYAVCRLSGDWEWIYLMGAIFGFTFTVIQNKLVKEPFSKTEFFSQTGKKIFILVISSFLVSAISYIDRLIIYPILGGAIVSIYYVSSLFGKAVSMVMTPISSLLLSYLTQMNEISKSKQLRYILLMCLLACAGYFICILIAPYLLPVLYPTLAQNAMPFIQINTLTAMITLVCAALNPFILRFRSTGWQIAIATSNLAIYLAFSLLFMSRGGLWGFCVGALIAGILKFIMMLLISLFSKTK